MAKRVWIIEGWKGTELTWSKEIPHSALTESQVKDVLKCLVAKHGLTDGELVSAFVRKNSKLYGPHLEVQESGNSKPWWMSCGGNPYFTARVGEQPK
ncbi:hypothetical protein [Pseudomonas sp. NPDC089569]|uniref:hypothetical protein n=1 Tax=Pseudomonas sp. NPDC089569 TaxID=3390722 RepID=UPI003D0731A8